MSKRKIIHIVPNKKGGWKAKEQGKNRALKNFDTKDKKANEWAKKRINNYNAWLSCHKK